MRETEVQFYDEVLSFLEDVYDRVGEPSPAGAGRAGSAHALSLNFAKVVSDCRAILLLAENGLYAQVGILARSALDACYMLIYVGSEGEDADIVKRWLAGRRVTHWMVVEWLDERLRDEQPRVDLDSYREMRGRLDDFVHANYESLKRYPAQLSDQERADAGDRRDWVFWRSLMRLFLTVCLLVVRLTVPELDEQAGRYHDCLAEIQGEVRP